MGFDNESIVNIQSLAGEYFCPVCRTLVYPNEALQSQCTHLYCKPCLTYVVATTKACPYDGYLVTEADSKPLVESNKALAEVIGKIPVHCLFHRSGCSWQGPLSECTSHCSGCAFGNSPVVCNRCGIQIVHRQVQEHAQNCPGTNPQAQAAQQNAESLKDYAMSGTIMITNSSQTSQAQVSQTTNSPPPAQDSNQANTNPQVQGIASAAGTTAGQWYPQQYYQQFPGYDPYQQYYLYQQPTTQQLQQQAPHVAGQPQVFAQHQTAIQPHPQPLPQVQGQPQSHPQPQMQPQPYPQSQQQQTSQHQLQIAPQGQPQAHSHVQNQVNPQHQSHPVIQPQLQSHNQPPVQGQNPQQLAYPQLQTHLFPKSMQPPGQQNFQAPLYQQTQSQGHQGQPQMQPQPHSHMQPLLPSHAQTQNHPHPLQPNNPLNQHPATTHVVPGHQSHQPIQPHQQMLPGAPQHHPMYMHPSTESLPPTAQFPPESPHMRPPQASASMPNQQPNLMHSQGQLQGFPPVQHQQILSQTQQGHGFQGPVVQPMQQPIQQYGQHPYPLQISGLVQGPSHQQLPYAQQPMHTHSRPQVPTQSLQHGDVSVPAPPPHSGVQASGMPPHQSQTYAGRPAAPNNAMPPQQFQQSGGAFGVAAQSRSIQPGSVQTSGNQNFEGGVSNQQQVPPGQQLSQSGQADKHTLHEGNAVGQEAGSASKRTAGNDVSRGAGRESVVVKPLGSQTCEKNGDEEHRAMNELENIGANGILDKDTDAEVNAVKLGFSEPPATTFVEEDANRNLGGGNEVKTSIHGEKDSSVVGLKQVENSSAKDSNVRALENISSQELVKPQRLAVDEFGTFQDKGVINSSNPGPLTDQGKHHLPSGTSESSPHQQRLAMPSNFQSGPYPGAPPNALIPVQGPAQIRPQGPGILAPPHQSVYPSEHFQQSSYSNDIPFGGPVAPGLTTSFGQGTGQPVHRPESFELSGAQRGQQYQNNPPSQPVFSRTFSGEPVRGGPLHGPDGAAMLQNQRTNLYEGRYSDHSVSGTFDRGQYAQPPVNDNRALGFHTASGLRAKNVNDDHRNPFVVGPTGHLDQGEYPEAPKQIPKPSIMGVEPSLNFRNGFSSGAGDYSSHDLNYDTPSKFLPPYNLSGGFHPNDIGERPSGFQENHRARVDSARTQLDFLNRGPGFGMDRIPPRSPGREYHGIPSRGSGPSGGLQSQSGIDDIHGRDTRTVNEGSRSFYKSSDSVGKPFRGDMVGQDFIPNQLRMGETFGPRDLPSHTRRGDGFGTFADPHMGELTGPGGLPRNDSFAGNKSNHPRLGEPGFRSSYSLHGFPSDGGFYAGKFDSFDRFKASMGWCRICKVDCYTVEGLDLHSQTMEHQQRTMDMVISIKQQNAKRQKTSKDHSSTGEGSRSRNARNRGRGKKA